MEKTVTLKKAQFVIGDIPEVFDGYQTENSTRWNGWSVPIFDEAQLHRLIEHVSAYDGNITLLSGSGLRYGIYDSEQDETIVLEPLKIGDVDFHVYTFDGWCFENVADFTPEEWQERLDYLAEDQK